MGFFPAPISVIAIEDDDSRMDCCDNDSRKAWVVVGGWSYRRAILTHAAPFMEAMGTKELTDLVGQTFLATMDLRNPPPFEHEYGERIEFPGLELAPPMSEIYKELGMPDPEQGVNQ